MQLGIILVPSYIGKGFTLRHYYWNIDNTEYSRRSRGAAIVGKFSIFHVSDIHFSAEAASSGRAIEPSIWEKLGGHLTGNPGQFATSHTPEILATLANFLYTRIDLYDLLLYTGDLATTGHPDDLRGSHKLVCESASLPTDSSDGMFLNTFDKPFHLLPGNHDRYKVASAEPGGTEFEKAFAPSHWSRGARVMCSRPYSRSDGTLLVVIRADLTLYSKSQESFPFGYFGQGIAQDQILESLSRTTDAVFERFSDRTIAIVWCIHFDPICSDQFTKLLNRDALVRTIEKQKHKICAVLCGHTHKGFFVKNYAKRTALCVAGAAPRAGGENSLNRIEITVNPDPELPTKCRAEKYLLDENSDLFEFHPGTPGDCAEWIVV